MLYLTSRICENVTLRAADSLNFPLTKEALEDSLNRYNTATLEELKKVNIHDFGIYLQLEPDEEENVVTKDFFTRWFPSFHWWSTSQPSFMCLWIDRRGI